ncbi:MAG: iron-containing alcohol dehydrogenase, partial [Thalassobaculaceae bacterium]|nr:iron-containing alcohol dehydrogenase [Thalassobaculaceae bacterium]
DHAGDHAGGASVGDVAEGVGAYHFDQCDAVVGVGTGAIVDLATLVAFMSGQRHPLTDLAAVSANIDPRGVAPSFAVATDLTGVAALGGASLILDDRGCPFLLRDAALRPAAAAYCPAPGVGGLVEGREIVAALAIDAGDGGAADSLMATTAGDASSLALDIAGLLERRLGPARVLAVYGMIAGGIPQPATLACLIATSGVGADVAAALDPSRTARPLLDALSLDALAHIDRTTLPVDISGMLVMLGRDIPAPRRRGGRGGAARGRRSE